MEEQNPYGNTRITRPVQMSLRVSKADKKIIDHFRFALSTVPGKALSESDVVSIALNALSKSKKGKPS